MPVLPREVVNQMSPAEKCEYQRNLARERQQRRREKNREAFLAYNREYTQQYRAANKERNRELSRKHAKAYRERQEAEKNMIKNENAFLQAEVERLNAELKKKKPKRGKKANSV